MADPNTSIRELIFQNLKTAIQGINGNPNYFNKIAEENVNIIHGLRAERAFKEPYIYIYPDTETIDMDKSEKGKFYKVLSIGLEIWIKVADEKKETMNTEINKIIADVEKAIMLDASRGTTNGVSNAVDTRLVSSEAFLEALDSPRCGVLMLIDVDYQQSAFDPASLTV